MLTLDFASLDDLAIAVERRQINPIPHLTQTVLDGIGPLLELLLLNRGSKLSSLDLCHLPTSMRIAALTTCLKCEHSGRGIYVSSQEQSAGFIATARDSRAAVESVEWTQFCRNAELAAKSAGLVGPEAKGLVGAMIEIEENVHRHSNRAFDGVVGFYAKQKEFEFVVADSGDGVLASLKSHPDYADLRDAGTALKVALADGNSRFGRDSGNGYGFHGLFVGMANLNGNLRFRTEDHALLIDGTTPSLVTSRIAQKCYVKGFLVSAVCRPLVPDVFH